MKTKALKYSKGSIKERKELSGLLDGKSFEELIEKSAGFPLEDKFDEVDLGNGYIRLVKKSAR